jgi:hypothetical protein
MKLATWLRRTCTPASSKDGELASNQFVRNEMNLRNGDKLQVIAPLLSEAEEEQVVFVTGITRPSLLGLKFRIYVLTP